MADATEAVSNAASNVVQGVVRVGVRVVGKYLFFLECDSATARNFCKTAVSMYGIYTAAELIKPLIRDILARWLGGTRDDQAIGEPRKGSLLVELQCFTDERFMKVWVDYESGEMKERLQKEFSKSEIDVEGLKIGIQNLKEVNETRARVENRIAMASSMEHVAQGYDESRFEGEVRQDLFCSICLKVLKDPKACTNKEHPFCFGCITEHLKRSSTCPECRDHLTPETLKNPPRFLMNTLLALKINCDNNDRGCSEYVSLENLQHHVDQCEYAPVKCENEGCGMDLNKRDKENHVKDLCQFRVVKYRDLRGIKANQDEMKQKLNETNVKIDGIERKQSQIDNKVGKIKENVEEMKQQYEKICQMMSQLLQVTNGANKGSQALDPAVLAYSAINEDIIIIGGRYGSPLCQVLNTVEKLNVVKGKSVQLPSMNQPRAALASCVYNNDVIVAGGYDGHAGTDTIEILKMEQHPLAWTLFDGKLPVKLSAHAVVLYQGNIFITGGYDWNEKKKSNAVYVVRLLPPYTSKLLVRLPQAISMHCAEVVNDKLFIMGGTKTGSAEDATDSVVLYDVIKNKFKPCASLPSAVWGMSTATWGNMIIVLGGADKNNQPLNDVIMYDTETGQSKKLPSMIHKRYGCLAVIKNDVIVVIGGWNDEHGYLNTVETFTIGSDGWKELPRMNGKRRFATAVVVPGYQISSKSLVSK